MAAADPKSTQRERLISGMVAAANRDGYAGANVAQVIAQAGVSRPTFYDYFADKDDCFMQTNRDIARRLLRHIRNAVSTAPPEQAMQAAVRRLIERCEAQPAMAHFLANITMAGGPRALDERDRTVRDIGNLIDDARAASPPNAVCPDLPARTLIGAVHRLLAPRVRSGDHDLGQLTEELLPWIERYNRPYRRHRWRTLELGPPPVQSPYGSNLSLRPPPPLPPGRLRPPSVEVARNQRERIMYAVAELATRKGYTATTIADIKAAAHVDQRVFYTHFRDKQQAFLAVHELAIHQTMAAAASGYFSASSWPERIWQGLLAGSQLAAKDPNLCHMGYVEAHAVGGPAIQRVLDTQAAFMIFLHEGNQLTENPPSRTAMSGIDAVVFELGYEHTRVGMADQLPRLAYLAAYLVLAPYLGTDAADEFVDAKLRESAAAAQPSEYEDAKRRTGGSVKRPPAAAPAASRRRPRQAA